MFRMSCIWMIFACLFIQEPRPEQKLPDVQPLTPEAIAGRYGWDIVFVRSVLKLTADGRFTSDFTSDTGSGQRQGTFAIVDGMIEFHESKADDEKKKGDKPQPYPNLYPVRWGKRIYLIDDKRMTAFCGFVNFGSEPREDIQGDFYAKMAEKKADEVLDNNLVNMEKPHGLPEVPERWKSDLLKNPVEGKIVAKLPDDRARINVGSADGLKVGMLLLVDHQKVNESEHPYGLARVDSVKDRSAIVKDLQNGNFQDGFEIDWKVRSQIEDKYRGSLAEEAPYILLR